MVETFKSILDGEDTMAIKDEIKYAETYAEEKVKGFTINGWLAVGALLVANLIGAFTGI